MTSVCLDSVHCTRGDKVITNKSNLFVHSYNGDLSIVTLSDLLIC